MKLFVSDTCIGCGLCTGVCPDVFRMTDAGVAEAAGGEIDPSLEASALEAKDGCPVGAIEEA